MFLGFGPGGAIDLRPSRDGGSFFVLLGVGARGAVLGVEVAAGFAGGPVGWRAGGGEGLRLLAGRWAGGLRLRFCRWAAAAAGLVSGGLLFCRGVRWGAGLRLVAARGLRRRWVCGGGASLLAGVHGCVDIEVARQEVGDVLGEGPAL